MKHPTNLNSVRRCANKKDPVIADAKPKFISSVECFDVTFSGLRKAMQSAQNAHRCGLIQPTDIGLSHFRPDD
jgi:hypothetical protein